MGFVTPQCPLDLLTGLWGCCGQINPLTCLEILFSHWGPSWGSLPTLAGLPRPQPTQGANPKHPGSSQCMPGSGRFPEASVCCRQSHYPVSLLFEHQRVLNLWCIYLLTCKDRFNPHTASWFINLCPTESTTSPDTAWSAESSRLLWRRGWSVLTMSCSSASRPCRGFDVEWEKNFINNDSEAAEWFSPSFWWLSPWLWESVGAQLCHCYHQALLPGTILSCL